MKDKLESDVGEHSCSYTNLCSGAYLTEHAGRFIRVERVGSDWLAQTVKRQGACFVDDDEDRLYDTNKTRQAAVDMVVYLIDED